MTGWRGGMAAGRRRSRRGDDARHPVGFRIFGSADPRGETRIASALAPTGSKTRGDPPRC